MDVKRFEDFVGDIHKLNLSDEFSTQIPTFGEYRKGSEKFGGLLTKMMEWLRLEKEKDASKDTITVDLNRFLSESGIKLNEMEDFIKDKIAKGLYNFEIRINYDEDTIIFSDLVKKITA